MDRKLSDNNFAKPQIILILLIILGYLIFNLPITKSVNVDGPVLRFFDVGQGDASLITTKQGQNILIDGGPNNVVESKLDNIFGMRKKELSAVIITHPHADHIAGLIGVLDKYEVKDLYFTGVVHTAPEYLELLKVVKGKGIPTHNVIAGDRFDLGVEENLEFLYPAKDLTGQKVDNLNDSSIVVRYVYKDRAAIFMGDLEEKGQSQLLELGKDIKSDIIKVAHHGSKDSAFKGLIDKVNPAYAVIQVGRDNKFGHPSREALDILNARNILRTDFSGDVTFNFKENGGIELDKEK